MQRAKPWTNECACRGRIRCQGGVETNVGDNRGRCTHTKKKNRKRKRTLCKTPWYHQPLLMVGRTCTRTRDGATVPRRGPFTWKTSESSQVDAWTRLESPPGCNESPCNACEGCPGTRRSARKDGQHTPSNKLA